MKDYGILTVLLNILFSRQFVARQVPLENTLSFFYCCMCNLLLLLFCLLNTFYSKCAVEKKKQQLIERNAIEIF